MVDGIFEDFVLKKEQKGFGFTESPKRKVFGRPTSEDRKVRFDTSPDKVMVGAKSPSRSPQRKKDSFNEGLANRTSKKCDIVRQIIKSRDTVRDLNVNHSNEFHDRIKLSSHKNQLAFNGAARKFDTKILIKKSNLAQYYEEIINKDNLKLQEGFDQKADKEFTDHNIFAHCFNKQHSEKT
jgi:hypothetical protein